MSAERISAVIEDVEFLIGTDSTSSIAGRLGYANPKNLSRVLYRAGRPDLAARFGNDEGPAMSTQPDQQASRTDAILSEASDSTHVRTRNLAAKIRSLLADLTARLADESAEAVRAERIAELEAEIRRLKSGGTAKAAVPVVAGTHECDECDRSFPSGQGLSMHRRRAHEGFDPKAAAS